MKKGKKGAFLRRLSALAALLLICSALLAGSAFASVKLQSVETTVLLNDDGSADITEVWSIDADEGTEMYLVKDNMDGSEISDLEVSDETGQTYVTESSWDVDRTLAQKAGRCGLVTGVDYYEVCWGLGSYGSHTYTVKYHVTKLVDAYDDNCGFNWRFVNDYMSSAIDSATIHISKPGTEFTSDDVLVWAFGFTGEIWVQDGEIVAYTTAEMQSSSYINVLASFPHDMFTPDDVKDGSFETLREYAMQGSDYTPDDGEYDYGDDDSAETNFIQKVLIFAILLFVAVCITAFVAIIVAIANSSANKGKGNAAKIKKGELKDIDYCRELPYEGSLTAARYALQHTNEKTKDSSFIGAYLLRWLQRGYITVTERPVIKRNKDTGKTQKVIVFERDALPDNSDGVATRLWNLLVSASGQDKVLEPKELSRWMSDHYSRYFDLIDSCDRLIYNKFLSAGYLKKYEKAKIFGGTAEFTDLGKQKVRDILGFKKYLEDFTIIAEREPYEAAVWQEYLVFAQLFGIAKEVADQFAKLCPEFITDANFNYGDDYIFIGSLAHMAHSGASSGRSASSGGSSYSGGGGFSSSGGGGGFSGGGSGGGVR